MSVTGVNKPTSQDDGVAWTVRHAYAGSTFFRDLLDGAGLDPERISGIADLPSLPFTDRQQLRDAYPFGWNAVELDEIVRVHASRGTTGKQTIVTYTANDLDDWAEQSARCLRYAGVTLADRVQIMAGYGLWTAGMGFQAGVEWLGAMAVPAGPGDVDLQLELMIDFQTTVLCATSSFALLIAEEVERRRVRDRLALRVGLFGSERWGEAMRRRIETLLGIEAFDIYGLTELWGPGTGIECTEHDGIHYWDDYYVVEIVDSVDLTPLPAGEEGEVVLTTLGKEGMPLLRYRTRDLSRIYPDPCPCGSPYPRMARLTGSADDHHHQT